MTDSSLTDNIALDSDSMDEALNTILKNDELTKHFIFEDEFITNVIPLLVRPWDESNLIKYKKYVLELTNELRIISREPEPKVIAVVPALYPRVTTSSPDVGKAGVGDLAVHLQREKLRSPFPQDEIMTDFLTTITMTEPVEETVLKPLARILARYGRALEDDDGTPLYSLPGKQSSVETQGVANDTPYESSYTDEYED